jgi:hypothetical protein
MTPENFCYWLQGFFELTNSMELTPAQHDSIKEHLQLVFKKTTSIPDLFPQAPKVDPFGQPFWPNTTPNINIPFKQDAPKSPFVVECSTTSDTDQQSYCYSNIKNHP